jgi:NTE family protein
MERLALVLGAGGHAAIAWETGVLAGLADAGVHVCDADVIVGTSAGSLVGAQITSDLTLEALFQRRRSGWCSMRPIKGASNGRVHTRERLEQRRTVHECRSPVVREGRRRNAGTGAQ